MEKSKLRMMALAAGMILLVDAGAFAQQGATTSFKGHSYALYESGLSWSEAKSFCEEQGGHLVSITSRAEQKAIADLLKSGSKKFYWVGGYKPKAKSASFVWVTGEKFSYTDWNTGCPSDSNMGNKNSTMVYKSTGRWADENGDKPSGKASNLERYGFICEWDDDYLPGSSGSKKSRESEDGSSYAIVMEEGDSIRLGSGTWKSSDTSVIKVSKKGKATAVGEGLVTLTSSEGMQLVVKVEEEEE